jgi:hypothetical protein
MLGFLIKALDPEVVKVSKEGATGRAKPVGLTEEDMEALSALRSHHGSNVLDIDSSTTDVVDGRVPHLERRGLILI